MPEVRVIIGGREFDVACQDGEEQFLRSAARMLDTEAAALLGQIGRVPEGRMLLMAGLRLADKTAGLEDQLRAAEARARDADAAYDRARTGAVRVEVPVEVPVQVPVMPEEVVRAMTELTERAEAIADEVYERLSA